jgi:hypothetical protein
MNWNDLGHFEGLINSKGLEFKEQETTDYVVISSLQGALWEVDWIGFENSACYAIIP